MLYAIILGVLQGISEFLPISSSGHLVLVQNILTGFDSPGLVFDVVLHAGTLVAVIAYYRRDLKWLINGCIGNLNPEDNKEAKQWTRMLLIGTIPAACIGVFAGEFIESMFENPLFTRVFLCGTGCVLFLGQWLSRKRTEKTSVKPYTNALIIGFAQALALFPGISRSGSTMAAGLAVGWSRNKAARFSFLLMIPAVSGAVFLKIPEIPQLVSNGSVQISEFIAGFLAAVVTGYFSIILLLQIIRKYSFNVFAVYCLIVGGVSLAFNLFSC